MSGFQMQKILYGAFGIVISYLAMSQVQSDILVAKLDDITVATNPSRGNDLRVTERLCVASNPVGPYSLSAIGSGPDGGFSIQNGPYSIAYELFLRDRRSGGGFRALAPNIPLTGLLTRRLRNNQGCPGNAARLRMIIRKETLSGAAAGIYQGSLQLTVIPE